MAEAIAARLATRYAEITESAKLEDESSIEPLRKKDDSKRLMQIVGQIVDWWNAKYGNTMRLTYKAPGTRTWTRGDGTRYRDPAKITAYPSNSTTISNEEIIAALWKALMQQPGARQVGNVSGEFGSDAYSSSLSFLGVTIVNRGSRLEVMSRSRTSNKNSVWRQQ